MRIKRLYADWQKMQILNNNTDLISIEHIGDPPEKYNISYLCKGLIWMPGNTDPSISNKFNFEIYLHQDYPRLPPVIRCTSNIFHPNILPVNKNGGVCIGSWTPAESLDQLCIRLGEMIQYRNYSLSDALDIEAAAWVSQHINSLPIDNRSFWKTGKRDQNEIVI